uniref:Putative secreted protein n=1 Tax=Amblyomma triste TaxID=251400 RepID=A0A023GC25_AMBTT
MCHCCSAKMKLAVIFMVVLSVAVVGVWATSQPICAANACDQATCQAVECSCGTHKDYCGCCDFCNKCPNEECTMIYDDPCTEGHHCVLDNPQESFATGGKGHCRPESATVAGSHN